MSDIAVQAAGPTPLVMQLIVDRSLTQPVQDGGWPRGPLMSQAAHAAVAVISRSLDQSLTQAYISSTTGALESMHKIVLVTSPKQTIRELSSKLDEARQAAANAASTAGQEDTEHFPLHHLWIEQPENIPTVLAIAPNRKPAALKKILNKCTLLRD
ncbi:hypothetical protein IE81DRAFT_322959 [Ceraceosorus guamensis]|uniref:peptidyl-tRNA hydrolase n=1 Tax=Ceraceosorus guamensis TaxID=1522189 RepID=A0A316VZS8_9BASI|nr:hypothetical protein IE81DRAFT_322959 [Ceraceosorus guamensis]PWN43030.1 hypothetical protein IE81DRAFT_322959 [Ceraceosorus guamensis]